MKRAFADLFQGLAKAWVWTALAMQDIRLRYRGSMLGPFWLTLNVCVMIASMGFLYAKLFRTEVETYLPFLTAGIVFWQMISTTISDCCSTFIAAQNIIQQVRMPFSIHVYRVICRNLIVLAHTIVVIPLVLIILQRPIGWQIVLVVPGALLLAINGVFLGLLLGMVSARFRDVPPIVQNFVQVLFFITPIFWAPEMLGRWAFVSQFNPLFAAIDIMRSPIVGPDYLPYSSWLVMLGVTVVLGVVALVLFSRFRARLPYWV